MPRPKNMSPCSVEGCIERATSRGMCSRHYDLWRRPPRGAWTKRHETPDGYIRVWCPGHPMAMADGYVLEHRKVLHDAGIEIPDGHHVHHRNGIKDDNRIENLEVILAGDHTRHHLEEQGEVENQYGVWPLRDIEGQRRRRQEYMREWRRRNRARVQDYKRRRAEQGLVP